MKKVFLLLRNNIQLGPFTIDELLQQKLSTDDLIWVEGYSLAWSHPSELNLLKLSNTTSVPLNDVKPSAPDFNQPPITQNIAENQSPVINKKKRKWADEDIEGRAEEIRKRTLEYVASKNTSTSPLITDDEIRSFVKTDIDFVVHKKRRGVSANFIGASLVALMLIAGWYGKDKLFIAQNNSDISSTQDVAPQVIPISSTVQLQPSLNESAAFSTEETEDSLVVEEVQDVSKNYITPAKPAEQPAVVTSIPDNNQDKISEEPKAEKQTVKANEDQKMQPEKKETAAVSSKPDSAKRDSAKTTVEAKTVEETEESVEKKKTLGQAIKGLFKKKKKDKDTDDETEENN